MISECNKYGMKPVCDEPGQCAYDSEALYLGQQYSLAYPSYRSASYTPNGFQAIRSHWMGTCGYYNRGESRARCNIPVNSYQWQTLPRSRDRGFICGRRAEFPALLGKAAWKTSKASGAIAASTYTFVVAHLATHEAANAAKTYSDQMRLECRKYGMKPVCNDAKACAQDKSALFLGQSATLATPAHRKGGSVPSGFAKIAAWFNGRCFYAGKANRGNAMCENKDGKAVYATPVEQNSGFVCGARGAAPFSAKLGAMGSVKQARVYTFLVARSTPFHGCRTSSNAECIRTKATMSAAMVRKCAQFGMKPVCDDPGLCASDPKALYLGQPKALANPANRIAKYTPSGFSAISSAWAGLCGYGDHSSYGERAYCQYGSHAKAPVGWKKWTEYDPGFVCGRVATDQAAKPVALKTPNTEWSAHLGSLPGYGIMTGGTYTFKRVEPLADYKKVNKLHGNKPLGSGKDYANIMIHECAKLKMKPVCEHPSYCRNDKNALYLAGNHISIPSYHSSYSYWYPTGFHRIKDKFAAACYYTGKARGNYALCNIPSNSHAWRTVAQYNPGFVCGSRVNMNFTSVTQAVDRAPFSASLGASFAYSLPVHSSHTRRDRVAPSPPFRLHGAAVRRAPPHVPSRVLSFPCRWDNAGAQRAGGPAAAARERPALREADEPKAAQDRQGCAGPPKTPSLRAM